MTAIYDGIAGLINDVFGDAVTYTPASGVPREVVSIFREEPVDLQDADGHLVRSLGPTWRVKRVLVPELKRGDTITLRNGRVYEVQATWPSGSPAADCFEICDLFRVTP